MYQHMEIQHGGSVPHTREVGVGGGEATTYVMSFPRVLKTVKFPVTGCPAVAHNAAQLRQHFIYRHLFFTVGGGARGE